MERLVRLFRLAILLCVLIAGCATPPGQNSQSTNQNVAATEDSSNTFKTAKDDCPNYECLKVFSEILAHVQKHYIDQVKTKDLVYASIRGMLTMLDPATAYMEPAIYREVKGETDVTFGGVGLQIGIKDGRLVVISPIDDTPAQKVGIQPGDHIIKINDEPTADMNLLEAVHTLRGRVGSTLVLTIQRKDTQQPLAIQMLRERITLESVRSRIINNQIGYVRLTQFQDATPKDLNPVLKQFREQRVRGVILDLRNNPGGLLTSCIGVADQLLDPGKVIVTLKTRVGRKDDYLSKSRDVLEGLPLIVLVNAGTASGSEILAAALQDWNRAMIVGTPTFGRGTVQTILPLGDGSGLRLTTAVYSTPKGREIRHSKIKPDVVIEEKPGDDAPLGFAVDKLMGKLKAEK